MVVGIRPRVLHIRSSSDLLGAERVVIELLRHSPNFGVEASLLVLRDPSDPPTALYKEARDAGADVIEMECGALPTWPVLKKLRQVCVENAIDVVHCHGYKEDILACLSGIKARKVATNHLWKRTNFKLWVYSLLDALSLRSFQHVVAVSVQILTDMKKLGLSSSKMSLIMNGIDLDAITELRPDRESFLSMMRVGKNTKLIASLSSLTPEKGIDVLVEAIAKIRKMPEMSGVPFKVLIIGGGPERNRLETMIADLGLKDYVIMLGHRSDAREILKMVDIFVLPSRNEGLPISLLEAMAAKCAVVGTDVGEVKAVLAQSDQGTVVKPDDAEAFALGIAGYLTNTERLESCKQRGFERVKESFSAQEMTRQYCEIYTRIVGDSAAATRQAPIS